MYIRYIQVFKNLEDCYDQMIHPQKREDIKMALENCIGQLINTKYVRCPSLCLPRSGARCSPWPCSIRIWY